ncbi:MAG: EVE domain-containing protein, partial [Phycisphaerales bacterium]
TEPDVYSIDDLCRDGTTGWDGVRNYQARNFMRDGMQPGDVVLVYHSNADPAGIAERELVTQLVPAPLGADARRAMAVALGLGATEAEAVALLDARYQAAIERRHRDAERTVRARIASSHRMAPASGALEPQPGPELVAVLRESAAWRATLASADAEWVQGLADQRRSMGPEGPSMVLVRRAAERDGMPANDPLADVRLPELIDVAGLDPAPRRAIEEAMEPMLAKVAAAIAARRRTVDAAEVERAAASSERSGSPSAASRSAASGRSAVSRHDGPQDSWSAARSTSAASTVRRRAAIAAATFASDGSIASSIARRGAGSSPATSMSSGSRTSASGSCAGMAARAAARRTRTFDGPAGPPLRRGSARPCTPSASAEASVARHAALSRRTATSSGPGCGSSAPLAGAMRWLEAMRARTARSASRWRRSIADW